MTVDWHDPETAQIAIEGRRQAMIDRNLEAVELFNHNRRLGRFASLETVHFAVNEAGCDRSIAYDTLLTLHSRNRPTDSHFANALHKWCNYEEAIGNRKGTWLRKKLEECLVLSNEGDADRVERLSAFPWKRCLNAETENYDGGPDDVLTINELEWNKVCVFHVSPHCKPCISQDQVLPDCIILTS